MTTLRSNPPGHSPPGLESDPLWARFLILLRHWRLLFVGIALFSLIGLTYSFIRHRRYRATASFVTHEPSTGQTGLRQLAAQYGLAVGSQNNLSSPQFYADLLKSRALMGQIVETNYDSIADDSSMTLMDYYHTTRKRHPVMDAIKHLNRDVHVHLARLTGVITLNVDLKDPDLAAAVGTRFIQLLNDYNINRRRSQARSEREFLERRVAEALSDLQASEDSLVEFKRRNRTYTSSPELAAEAARLERQTLIVQQLYLRLAEAYETAKLAEVRATPVLTVLDNPDRLVEPRPRGIVRNVSIGAVLGFILVATFVILTHEIARQRPARAVAPDGQPLTRKGVQDAV